MKNIVIGTAGHIDHGKTSLIKALTGTDTDTLKEEKQRGITVNLGFTSLKLDDTLTVGVVDVPGHEKLIKNMLAGIFGMDLILFTIAANDGIMPQTVEHMEIIKFLKVKHVIIVITKTDLVSKERIEEVKDSVKKQFGFDEFITFNIYDKQAIEGIKSRIKHHMKTQPASLNEPFRLPIDRAFNVKGYGVVVTGTSLSGEITVGDELELLPSHQVVKVKGIQAFNQSRTKASKHMRVALNLSNVKKEALKRGDILATKKVFTKSEILDIKLEVSKSLKQKIKHLERVKFNYLTSEITCRIKLFNQTSVEPGETIYAQLLLDEPVYANQKDLGIIRSFNPSKTIGGAEIINVFGDYVHRKDENYANVLSLYENNHVQALITYHLNKHPFTKLLELKHKLNLSDQMVKDFKDTFEGVIFDDQSCLTKTTLNQYEESLKTLLNEFHQNYPFETGMNKKECQQKLSLDTLSNKIFNALVDQFEGVETVKDKLKLRGYKTVYNKEEKAVIEAIMDAYTQVGYRPKKLNEMISSIRSSKAKNLVYALIKEGQLIKVDDEIIITKKHYQSMIEMIDAFFKDKSLLQLGDLRDMLGASRKYVVAYLEYLDQIGYTKRVESGRVKRS